ncbi:MAG: hypothetical protein L0Y80_01985 [Ignavibacteriae bacterium]|nr:hypothetical protein [Ignavibacteriota bacterium]
MRAYLDSGRFWAEEGKVFYADLVNMLWYQSIGYLYNGHIELITNLIVYLSTLVSFENAPLITTYGSFFVQSIPVLFVIIQRKHFAHHWLGIIVFLFVILGLRQSAEVWANSVNLHFHFALLAALVLGKPLVEETPDWTSRILLALSGLSGVPANFLTPLFYVAAYRERNRERTIQAFILSATAILQIALILTHQSAIESRFLSFNILTFCSGLLSQQMISPFFPANAAKYLINALKDLPGSGFEGWLTFSVFLALYGWLLSYLYRSRSVVAKYLGAGALLMAIASVLTSLGDKSLMLSLDASGRYFFVPNCLLFLAWIATLQHYRKPALRIVMFIIVLIFADRANAYIHGKPWKTALQESVEQNKESVEIWPTEWTMKKPPITSRP